MKTKKSISTFWFILLPITLAVILLFSFLTVFVRNNSDQITTKEVNRSLLEVAKDVEMTIRTLMLNDPRRVLGFYRLIDGLRGDQKIIDRLNESTTYRIDKVAQVVKKLEAEGMFQVTDRKTLQALHQKFKHRITDVQLLPKHQDITTTIYPAPVVREEKLQKVSKLFPDRYPQPNEIETYVIATGKRFQGMVKKGDNRYFQVTSPILAGAVCTSCHTFAVEGQPLAAVTILADMKKPTAAIANLTRRVIIFGGVIISIILLIVFFVSKRIASSLAGLSQQALRFGDGDYEKPITSLKGTREIKSLALSFEGARIKIHDFIYDILQSMPGLLFIVNPDGRASSNFSNVTKEMFGDIENQNVDDVIFAPAGASVNEVVATVFNDSLPFPFDDIMAIAPKELTLQNEIIKLNYHPIYEGESDTLIKILIIGENITALRKSEADRALAQKVNAMILEIVKNPEGFREFYEESDNLIESGVELLKGERETLSEESVVVVQRILHTVKGSASIFQLQDLVTLAHEYEDQLSELNHQASAIKKSVISPMLAALSDGLKKADRVFQTYVTQKSNTHLTILTEDEVKALIAHDPEIEQMAVTWHQKRQLDFIDRKASAIVSATSNKLDKEVKLRVNGKEGRISDTTAEILSLALTHLLRNAVSHGIEDPETREETGKVPEGVIRIFAKNENGHLHLTIRDDGKGINPDSLVNSAVDKGLIRSAADIEAGQALDLIFASGFSTAETVTSVSGRGVGLDAVRHTIVDHQGTITVRSKEGVGTEFKIVIKQDL